MTYSIALNLDSGLVLMSDTRTNAGIDHITSYSKLKCWELKSASNGGDHAFLAVMSAGNLASAQKAMHLFELEYGITNSKNIIQSEKVFDVLSITEIAEKLGEISVLAQKSVPDKDSESNFAVAFILAGKLKNERHRSFLIYPEGNYIESMPESPMLQIGESKYGRAIISQLITNASSLSDGVQASLLSMDITSRYNASVGPPIDLAVLNVKSRSWITRQITEDDTRFVQLVSDWNQGCRVLFAKLPETINIDEIENIDVFISYSSTDRSLIKPIIDSLTERGLSVWWDYNLLGGDKFRAKILAKLEAAKSVVVLWSENSIESPFVLDEADRARKQGKLIPLKMPSLPIEMVPLGFGQLQTVQADDYETIIRSLAAQGVGS